MKKVNDKKRNKTEKPNQVIRMEIPRNLFNKPYLIRMQSCKPASGDIGYDSHFRLESFR